MNPESYLLPEGRLPCERSKREHPARCGKVHRRSEQEILGAGMQCISLLSGNQQSGDVPKTNFVICFVMERNRHPRNSRNTAMIRKTLLLVTSLGLLLVLQSSLTTSHLGEKDFLGYWSAAHLLITGGNPYDPGALRELQHAVRPEQVHRDAPTVMVWNPPWLILILLPLGILPFDLAAPVWVFCNVLMVGVALALSWQFLSQPVDGEGFVLALAAGFLYSGTVDLIVIGQTSGLVLLGYLLVIKSLRARQDVLAGAALMLTAIKPHVVYLAVLILFIWVMRNRRWWVLAGLAAAGIGSALIVWMIFPKWLITYAQTLSHFPYSSLYTSTLASFMSSLFGIEIFRFSAVLTLPLIPFLVRLLEKDFLTALNLSLLLSVPLSPYGFSFDQVVLLPGITQLVVWLWRMELPRRTTWIISICLAIVYILNLCVQRITHLPYYWLMWVPLALLGLYVWAWRGRKAEYAKTPPRFRGAT